MTPINFFDTIYKRKSIRKYDLTPLGDNSLSVISKQIENLIPLYPDIETEINIVSPADVNGLIQVKAPHYIIAFSEVKEGYLTNTGFLLQQLDLFFSTNEVGCCWQGWPKPSKELRNNQNLEFVIVLAFGLPKEKIHRASIQEFKRKPLDKIRNVQGLDDILEPARLAPSPSQPWFFTGDDQYIHVCCSKTSGIKAMLFDRLNRIEIGIALCHIWIAAQHFNKNIEFLGFKGNINVPKGYFYVISAQLS
jgi:hypothetical protein